MRRSSRTSCSIARGEGLVEFARARVAVVHRGDEARRRGEADAAVAGRQGAGHDGKHEQAGPEQVDPAAGGQDPVNDILQEQRGADAGDDVDDGAGKHQEELFPGDLPETGKQGGAVLLGPVGLPRRVG